MCAARKTYTANDPKQVVYKLNECRYFLDQMGTHDKAGETEQFKYALSAFLKSFRSIGYRLCGVTKNNALLSQLKAHPTIAFLYDKANLEVHGDGPTIWKRFNIQIADNMRYESRFYSTLQTQAITGTDWQFSDHSSNLLTLCRGGFVEMESTVKQNIP
jgi:hypothetical protein